MPPTPAGSPPEWAYHLAALRTYFLASRDLNQDGILDFDYEQSASQRKLEYSVSTPSGAFQANNLLPSPTMPAGYGPRIFVSN